MSSIWTKDTEEIRPKYKRLEGDIKTDVLIIGGGIAGVLCAHKLKTSGIDCILVEKGKICSGVAENTTAKITLQNGLIYDKMIKRFGVEKSKLYAEAQKNALLEYARMCSEIDCNFENRDSYVYSLVSKDKIEKEVEALNRLGVKADFEEKTELPFFVHGAARVFEQAQFHPLKFIFEIAKSLTIYENTKVLELKPNEAVSEKGKIFCKKMIIATHFPFLNKHGGYFLKMHQYRSYVMALENAQELKGMYVDEADNGMSFRSYNQCLLIGGGGHKTGKKGGTWNELEMFREKYYPKSIVVEKWATQDCITLDSIPYIGQYSKRTPNLFVATGFNKWGMTASMISSMILCDLVQGKKNQYKEVFSPSRSVFRPMLAVNAAESIKGLITPTTPRCPHLGCALKYNKDEHSWDCPCHGSRFSDDGEVLNNPATDDLQI